jgi:hypothetical protein
MFTNYLVSCNKDNERNSGHIKYFQYLLYIIFTIKALQSPTHYPIRHLPSTREQEIIINEGI